jgi:hypothetical protein
MSVNTAFITGKHLIGRMQTISVLQSTPGISNREEIIDDACFRNNNRCNSGDGMIRKMSGEGVQMAPPADGSA